MEGLRWREKTDDTRCDSCLLSLDTETSVLGEKQKVEVLNVNISTVTGQQALTAKKYEKNRNINKWVFFLCIPLSKL